MRADTSEGGSLPPCASKPCTRRSATSGARARIATNRLKTSPTTSSRTRPFNLRKSGPGGLPQGPGRGCLHWPGILVTCSNHQQQHCNNQLLHNFGLRAIKIKACPRNAQTGNTPTLAQLHTRQKLMPESSGAVVQATPDPPGQQPAGLCVGSRGIAVPECVDLSPNQPLAATAHDGQRHEVGREGGRCSRKNRCQPNTGMRWQGASRRSQG